MWRRLILAATTQLRPRQRSQARDIVLLLLQSNEATASFQSCTQRCSHSSRTLCLSLRKSREELLRELQGSDSANAARAPSAQGSVQSREHRLRAMRLMSGHAGGAVPVQRVVRCTIMLRRSYHMRCVDALACVDKPRPVLSSDGALTSRGSASVDKPSRVETSTAIRCAHSGERGDARPDRGWNCCMTTGEYCCDGITANRCIASCCDKCCEVAALQALTVARTAAAASARAAAEIAAACSAAACAPPEGCSTRVRNRSNTPVVLYPQVKMLSSPALRTLDSSVVQLHTMLLLPMVSRAASIRPFADVASA